jgi:hypothetical protein
LRARGRRRAVRGPDGETAVTGDKVFETAPSGARQEPETATKAVPAHCADTIKVALLRPGKVLHRSKKRFERTMVREEQHCGKQACGRRDQSPRLPMVVDSFPFRHAH